eukprot:1690886-Rhodomonas_salina.1
MEVQNVLYDLKATVNLISIKQLNNEGWTAIFLLHDELVNNVFMLTPIVVDIAEQTNMTLALPAASTVSHLNCKVDGLVRDIRATRATHVPGPCNCCSEANAIRQDFPDALGTWYTQGRDLWQWDMLDMGTDNLTINGNRYATVVTNKLTLFFYTFLHSEATGAETVRILCKARAKA